MNVLYLGCTEQAVPAPWLRMCGSRVFWHTALKETSSAWSRVRARTGGLAILRAGRLRSAACCEARKQHPSSATDPDHLMVFAPPVKRPSRTFAAHSHRVSLVNDALQTECRQPEAHLAAEPAVAEPAVACSAKHLCNHQVAGQPYWVLAVSDRFCFCPDMTGLASRS